MQPSGVNATFNVNSGTVGRSSTISWSRLSALAASGNDIGGKTLDGTPLTTLSTSQQISEMCNGRQNIISHEIAPYTFAYPGGAYNATIETDPQSWVPIELDTFNALLDWLQNAGQPGGAPAGVVVQTVRQVVNGS